MAFITWDDIHHVTLLGVCRRKPAEDFAYGRWISRRRVGRYLTFDEPANQSQRLDANAEVDQAEMQVRLVQTPAARTHHAVVEPLRDEVVQESGVDQFSVVQVESPEGEDHELQEGQTENKMVSLCDSCCLAPGLSLGSVRQHWLLVVGGETRYHWSLAQILSPAEGVIEPFLHPHTP